MFIIDYASSVATVGTILIGPISIFIGPANNLHNIIWDKLCSYKFQVLVLANGIFYSLSGMFTVPECLCILRCKV